ncbi:hypothetical protein BDV96DRAFT_692724 [Lophiotrema nucula]|uniref:Zn(2)-C6 fungal-type domain-containing protein n=1 Tax=Lophiotrema nucula TaxID=690887 RepID=A0A6A5YMY7_9PLEO|nr:hypothetical protein BDV96DRAFT_692724 [Lophiotrema nucula]
MSTPQEALARFSCTTCRSQKRKCSKELPTCELCRRNRRRCAYPPDSPSQYTSFMSTPSGHGIPSFPALFFLDNYTFKAQRGSIDDSPQFDLPSEFRGALGTTDQLLQDVDRYFSTIHTLFPVISKLRFSNKIITSITNPSNDTILLLLAMRLVSRTEQDSDVQSGFYDQVKRCYTIVERGNTITLKLLQAGLLIAFHENANAIYPAAYLTVRNCATLGQLLGIQSRSPPFNILPPAVSWTESEERRRTWWGVIMVDRYICIGTGGPFACPDTKPEDLLPVEESSWDLGEPTLIQSLAISSSVDIPASPFTRACQATHLLSRVLQHIQEKHSDVEAYYEEAKQLHLVLDAFSSAIMHKFDSAHDPGNPEAQLRLLSAIGICRSAQIALYDHYTCALFDVNGGMGTPAQLSMQQLALAGLKSICTAMSVLAQQMCEWINNGVDPSQINPFVCNSLYAAAMNYSWYIRETRQLELDTPLSVILATLRALGSRWTVAREYVKVLEAGQF